MKRLFVIIIFMLLVSLFSFGQDKEDVISLLYELDTQRTKFGLEITFIEEFNFGIPGGANWLVQWYERFNSSTGGSHTSTMIYIVDTDTKEIKFREQISLSSDDIPSYLLTYYQSLPGVNKADGTCQIGDFNNDGFDEILRLGASRLTIRGYDQQQQKISLYCNIQYGDIDEGYNSPPVEFITYKGRDGFKIRYYMYDVAGGYGYVPEPNQRNDKWFFYTWDEAQRKFVEIEEFDEDWEKTYREPSLPVLTEQNTDELAENREVQEEAAFASDDSGKNYGLNFYIVIAAGIIALAAVAVIIVAKSKKKGLK